MFTLRLLKIKIHSRRVFVFKRCLPIFAFLLAAIMIAWPALVEQKEKFSLAIPSLKVKKGSNVDMDVVRFFSKDKKHNPLTVVAATVQETDPERKIITLESPKATYEMSNGLILNSVSPYALAFQEEKYLYFEEQVDSTTDTGYHAVSTKVICDYNAGTIGSEQRVYIKGPAGMLNADAFFVSEKGAKINFKGNTETLLFGTEKEKSDIESLAYDKHEKYLKEDKKNTRITSENGLFVEQDHHTITAYKNVNVIQDVNRLRTEKLILTYEKGSDNKNKITKVEAYENVSAVQQTKNAKADTMFLYKKPQDISSQIAYLKKQDKIKIGSMPSQLIVMKGHVYIKEGNDNVMADKMYIFYQPVNNMQSQEIEKIVAEGHVYATNGKQIITGNFGIYDPNTRIITVYENVNLKEKNSLLKGEQATLNLKTGISSLSSPHQSKPGRVRGSLIPAELDQRK